MNSENGRNAQLPREGRRSAIGQSLPQSTNGARLPNGWVGWKATIAQSSTDPLQVEATIAIIPRVLGSCARLGFHLDEQPGTTTGCRATDSLFTAMLTPLALRFCLNRVHHSALLDHRIIVGRHFANGGRS